MKKILNLKIWIDRRAQDTIEYALLAGFLAVTAGAFVPSVTSVVLHMLGVLHQVILSAGQVGGSTS